MIRNKTRVLLVIVISLIMVGLNYFLVFNKLNTARNDGFLEIEQLEMDDPMLIYLIRKFFLESPSRRPYRLDKPNRTHYSQFNQSQFVAEYFKNKKFGTFVEAGAFTGEAISNSLYFEKTLGWKGILVEPVRPNQYLLRAKNRKSFFLPGCLAGKYPRRAKFNCSNAAGLAGCEIVSNVSPTQPHSPMDSWCFPLYSVLLAANMNRVDYLILDLEGFEMFVLEAIPFDKLQIKLIEIEAGIPLSPKLDPGRSSEFRNFFQTKWPQYREIDFSSGSPIDILFENVDLSL